MSLSIDVDTVTAVLLADGWHTVVNGSFDLDAYEYLWSGIDGVKVADLRKYPNERGGDRDPILLHGGGNSGVCATGFSFTAEDGDRVSGPLTAILAVRHRPEGTAA